MECENVRLPFTGVPRITSQCQEARLTKVEFLEGLNMFDNLRSS